jgi:hypothetical protein
VIISILSFGWLWGIGGGLLAAPLLAVIKIVCDQFETTSALGSMLGTSAHVVKSDSSTESTKEPEPAPAPVKPAIPAGPHVREQWATVGK